MLGVDEKHFRVLCVYYEYYSRLINIVNQIPPTTNIIGFFIAAWGSPPSEGLDEIPAGLGSPPSEGLDEVPAG